MKIYVTIAYILAFLMTVLNFAPSYSMLADTYHEYLLYTFLGAVVMAFIKRNKEYDELTAIMFIMVGVFSVNSQVQIIEKLHLAFTAIAIMCAFVGLISQAKSPIMELSAYVFSVAGTILFIFGYLFNWYTVAISELMISSIIVIPFFKR